MRIVHLGKYYPPSAGGIENVTRTLAQNQAARGADVTVIVINHASRSGKDVTFERLSTTPTTEEQDGNVRIIRIGRWANVAKLDVSPNLVKVLRAELRNPPDVWHLHMPNITMMLAVAAFPAIRPLVVQHHSDIVRQQVLRHVVRPLERLVYGRAARLVPTSESYIAGSELLRRFAERVTSIPLGIDLQPFLRPTPAALQYAEKLRREHGHPLWLSVGRLIYYKGLEVGLQALRNVPGKWLIVGTGPLETELKRKAVAFGVAERVVWLGRTSDDELAGAYHAATAFWFPSLARSEGFGLVQVEAMAAGCPVINTAIPGSGVAWVSPHEVSGLTVPVNDATAFADAARRLAIDSDLRARLVEGGRSRAEAEFDHSVMADRWLRLYEAVVTDHAK